MIQPNRVSLVPAKVTGTPTTYPVVPAMRIPAAPSDGLEFTDDIVSYFIISSVPFYWALAADNAAGNAALAANATRGWFPAGSWSISFTAEERNLFLSAIAAGTIAITPMDAYAPVI